MAAKKSTRKKIRPGDVTRGRIKEVRATVRALKAGAIEPVQGRRGLIEKHGLTEARSRGEKRAEGMRFFTKAEVLFERDKFQSTWAKKDPAKKVRYEAGKLLSDAKRKGIYDDHGFQNDLVRVYERAGGNPYTLHKEIAAMRERYVES